EADVARALEQQALVPLKMRPAAGSRRQDTASGPTKLRLKLRELLEFSRQLKVMLASGITILSTLALLRQRATGAYQRLLERIAADIQRGATLSDALAAHPRTFDPFYVGTIRAGEAAGVHTEALAELIAYYERRAGLRREVVSALTYPAIVVLTLIGACIVLLTCVVPQFQTIFAAAGGTLPLPTRALLAVSGFFVAYGWYVLATLLAVALGLWRLSPRPGFRRLVGRALARVPILGRVYHLATIVQFCRMLALLERAGLPVLESFRVVHEMLMAGPIKELVADARRRIAAGSSIADAIAGTRVLPDLVEQMIVVGEQSGRIDETLAAAAAHYEEELRVRIKRLTIMLEPVLTLTISALVLGVALAIFLPMWQMNRMLLKH
ncbi:MAG: type II secretion system F family protein, partial [Planctomycetota bacterium]